MACKICGVAGHNKSTCPSTAASPSGSAGAAAASTAPWARGVAYPIVVGSGSARLFSYDRELPATVDPEKPVVVRSRRGGAGVDVSRTARDGSTLVWRGVAVTASDQDCALVFRDGAFTIVPVAAAVRKIDDPARAVKARAGAPARMPLTKKPRPLPTGKRAAAAETAAKPPAPPEQLPDASDDDLVCRPKKPPRAPHREFGPSVAGGRG